MDERRWEEGRPRNATAAEEFCADLRVAGYSDWRLPSDFELSRVYDSRSPSSMRAKFPLMFVIRNTVWSDNPKYLGDVFNFKTGKSEVFSFSDSYQVPMTLCVRGKRLL